MHATGVRGQEEKEGGGRRVGSRLRQGCRYPRHVLATWEGPVNIAPS